MIAVYVISPSDFVNGITSKKGFSLLDPAMVKKRGLVMVGVCPSCQPSYFLLLQSLYKVYEPY